MKKGLLYVIELVILAVLFVLCFKKDEEFLEIADAEFELDEETGIYVSEDFSLPIGTYTLFINANDSVGARIGAIYGLEMTEGNYHALKVNDGRIAEGDEAKEIDFYVTGKVSDAHIKLQSYALGALPDVTFSLVKTASFNRILFVLALIAFAVLNYFVWLHKRLEEGNDWHPAVNELVPIGIMLMALIPCMLDYLIAGTNTLTLLTETEYFLDGDLSSVSKAHLPILWMPCLFRLIGFSVMDAYKLMLVALVVLFALLGKTLLGKVSKCVEYRMLALGFCMLNPVSLYLLYSKAAIIAYVGLELVLIGVCMFVVPMISKKEVGRYHAWIVFALSLALAFACIYFMDDLTISSNVYYWYDEAAFMVGG
jgi:hypothetical protein